MRQGRFKLLHDRIAKPLWPHDNDYAGSRTRLFDVVAEGREKADLSTDLPHIQQEMLEAWQRFDDNLLPYPGSAAHGSDPIEQPRGFED